MCPKKDKYSIIKYVGVHYIIKYDLAYIHLALTTIIQWSKYYDHVWKQYLILQNVQYLKPNTWRQSWFLFTFPRTTD